MKFKKWILIIIGVGLAVFASYKLFGPKGEQKTARVEKGTVSQELVLSGSLRAEEHALLTFQSSGELAEVNVKEGETVKKGQNLARLDTKVLYETYERAVSDLRSAQASLDSVYDQVQGHSTNESYAQRDTRTTAEVARDKAYRALEIAKENLSNGSIRSPFDGVVSAVTYPFTGINTTSLVSQIEVVNPESMYFEASADQTDIKDLKEGMKVRIALDTYPEDSISGTLSYLGLTPKEGEVGTVYKVKVALTDGFDPTKYRVGMGGDARFVISEKDDVLFAPPAFIFSDPKGKYVQVGVRKSKVYVETGIESEDKIEIIDEIKEGDTLYD